MPSIVFVCTANICRSPVAEALFRDWLRRQTDAREWQISSAGTWAADGDPASPYSTEVLAELGLDLKQHRARRVDRKLVESSDLIVCMTRSQREALQIEYPDLAARIKLLTALVGPAYDVADPYGGPRQGYVEMVQEVKHLLEAAGPRILASAARPAEPTP